MSNTMVGSVYQKIMDEVIENCVVTFEEDGVERKLLDEVKKTWQSKLSERKVASMPWDPTPAAAGSGGSQTASGGANARSQAADTASKQQAASAAQNGAAAAAAAASAAANAPAIKNEPQTSYDLQNLPQANGAGPGRSYNQGAAYERASQHLQERFGTAANPQITQLQARRAMSGTGAQAGNGNQPGYPQQGGQQQAGPNPQQQRQLLQQQQQQQQQQRSAVGNGQVDGASDWKSYVAERRATHAMHGADADESLRGMVEAHIADLEGGGIFERVSKAGKRKTKKARHSRREAGEEGAAGGFDGADDEMDVKEEDEDAINSELDDSADEMPEEEEEDGDRGEIMLCTYDKVQRVKNKWKCTLKDGVLTTGGKEYVFHKASGEFEW